MYIQYYSNVGEWEMWCNQTLILGVKGDPSTSCVSGSQPSVVVESNDFSPSDFSGFSTTIGQSDFQGYPLAAVVYLFQGEWRPQYHGNYIPAGYAYLGGNLINSWGVGTEAPSNEWGQNNIGETSSSRGVFKVGVKPSRAKATRSGHTDQYDKFLNDPLTSRLDIMSDQAHFSSFLGIKVDSTNFFHFITASAAFRAFRSAI